MEFWEKLRLRWKARGQRRCRAIPATLPHAGNVHAGRDLVFLLQNEPERSPSTVFPVSSSPETTTLRDDYLQEAQKVITDPMILINVISRRAKQLKSGYKPLIESLERLSAEDLALREVIEGKITYQLDESEEKAV